MAPGEIMTKMASLDLTGSCFFQGCYAASKLAQMQVGVRFED